ncbi:hypothetical protein EW146_g3073 [Bondarzewia mesenterica]|uniref:Protein kinase domain-containing protein n=1 Tax=Bondarzewia mesenterica TaxID=1095465 RepID=A0A4S4M4M0_9AGAM|nr:hypothetical protein EW146_g3073 [Bondarzewia mesenterica]
MAAVTMNSNLDSLSQPPSQASSPSATLNTFQSPQSLPPRAVINTLQYGRSQASLPGTPTSFHSSSFLDPPIGMKYGDFLRIWNDNHVSQWLSDTKCGHHANTFKANDIRGDVLLELDQNTLKEMGIASIGDRLRILNAVKTLRQRCSTRSERVSIYGATHSRMNGESRNMGHQRVGSATSPTSRLALRKLEHGRPPPLQLSSSANQQANLPHLIRDGQPAPDSASRLNMPPRPLPQPNQSMQSSSSSTPHISTPGSSWSTGARLPLPPVPRGQPPPPPARPSNRNLHPGAGLSGRRTPTQLEAPEYTSQPLPPAPMNQGLLTPSSAHGSNNSSWSGYGLPPDPRAGISGVKTPVRSQSPMLPNVPVRTSARSPNPTAHGRNVSMSSVQNGSGPVTKVGPRPATSGHPYSQAQGLQPPPQQNNILSPIAESFLSAHTPIIAPSTSPSPPITYTVGRGPFRPNTPSYNTTPSLVDLRKKLVKFQLADEGHSRTLNIEDCAGGIEVLEKALKKFGKLGGKSSDTESAIVGTDDGGLSVDGWGVYLDWGNEDSPGTPLTEAQLLAVCHAPPDDPAREHGLTLRRTGKGKRSKALAQIFGENPPAPGQRNSPTSPLFVGPKLSTGEEDEDGNLLSPSHGSFAATQAQAAKKMKRASSISVLSDLGVRDPEKALESPSSPTQPSSAGKQTSSFIKGPSKLRNFFGQRPPSELITNHLSEYFPFTEKRVLERTARHSMLRAGGLGGFGKRDSTASFAPPSRFSVSTLGSQRRSSHRTSASSIPPPVPDKSSSRASMMTVDDPPRVSLSTDDGHSVDLNSEEAAAASKITNKRFSQAHLLPPVDISFESFSESMNSLTGGQLGSRRPSTRPLSTASKRMSYVKELRSKRDVSDTASIMTVDEITAEVESRRESGSKTMADDESWTQVDVEDEEEKETPAAPIDVPPEGTEDEDDEHGNDDDDDDDNDDDETLEGVVDDGEDEDGEDDETGRAMTSKGIKWIKGALIGAGSFGKVYLGMDATNGLLMAVKQVEIPSSASSNDSRKKSMLDALEHEIGLLKDLQHEHIVQYLYSSADEEHFNIFLEYVPGGSVTALLRNYGAFEEPLVRNFVRQILEGLDYVHERGIVHRDIKGANVLVDNKGGIKISDFGISKKLEDNLMPGNRLHRPSLQGSVFWMAPEVVKQTAYTKKADIWSVGCLVVEMFTGEHPYPQLNQMQAIFKIGSSAKPTIPSDISAEAHSFLDLCFELDHEARPSAGQLLRHPWITKKPGGKSSAKSTAKESAS